MIRLKKILENKLPIKELIGKFLKFDEKTLIFFDIDTMGFTPEEQSGQLTRLGIIVINGSTMKDIKRINIKIELNHYTSNFLDKIGPARLAYEKSKVAKHSEQMLDMTKYLKKLPENSSTEAKAIQLFKHVVEQAKNPIIVSHNAKFAMSFLNVRARKYSIQIRPVPILDIKKFAEIFFIPALRALNDSQLLNRLKKFKLVKVSDIDKTPGQTITKSSETDFDRYTDPVSGEEYLKIYYGGPSSSLGKLSPALLNKIENWHEALSDIRIMIAVCSHVIEFLREHPDLDITQKQALAVRKAKSMAKKIVKKQKEDK